MHDVVSHLVLAAGDEDLHPFQAVAAIVVRRSLGLDCREIRAGLRLGEAHGARPFAGAKLGQVAILDLVRAYRLDGFEAAAGQTRIEGEGDVGTAQHLFHHLGQDIGQALATVFARARQADPAGFVELLVGLLHALGQDHFAVLPLRPNGIRTLAQRCDHAFDELGRLIHHAIDDFGRGILKAGQRRQLGNVKHVVQCEQDVFLGNLVCGHGESSNRRQKMQRR